MHRDHIVNGAFSMTTMVSRASVDHWLLLFNNDQPKSIQEVPQGALGNGRFFGIWQMRFKERLAGVRSDVAVKVFGDEFEPLLRAADHVASIPKE
jgi:Cu/Ag efflux pump CusA